MRSIKRGRLRRRSKPKAKSTEIPDYIWKAHGIPIPTREYQFAKPRKWRFDFVWVSDSDNLCAVEIEGGLFIHGGHSRGAAYIKNLEKYNRALELGYRVLRYAPDAIDYEQIKRVLTA